MQTLVDTTIHTTISVGDLPWEDIAACRAVPNAADLFFSEDIGDIAAAKRVCADCSVLAECLEAALDRRELFGVWGGQLFINGEALDPPAGVQSEYTITFPSPMEKRRAH